MTDMERYVLARWAYSVGKPILDDASYNVLHATIKRINPNSPYVNQAWSSDPCPIGLLKKYGMNELIHAVVLSDKTESIPSINSLVEVQSEYRYLSGPHTLSMKLDGWNIQASYYNGKLIHIQTRGRSSDAMDANVLSPMLPQKIPVMGKVLIIMELIVPDADFDWFRKKYNSTSQRGACSTALAHPADCLEHVKLVAHGIRSSQTIPYTSKFDYLRSYGFDVPKYVVVNNWEELCTAMDSMSAEKLLYGLPTDGLVCEGPNKVRAIRVKGWEEPIYNSYVQGYEEHYGPHSISIQVKIYPIHLQNSVQKQLPATNVARIMSLGLMPGAPVAFRIASSAIADIDEDATRLLQKQWEGRSTEYRFFVETNEALRT